ncbi:hypothetical protein AK966_06790 [Vibrio sp. PID23_8]|nr:hypothetical protein AK966_06790 [Vibrio sp. PID23_8]
MGFKEKAKRLKAQVARLKWRFAPKSERYKWCIRTKVTSKREEKVKEWEKQSKLTLTGWRAR